ncbi:MAG: thioredoxin domain-containing protein [Proteobacteria bacterium]|nr:thioredoxin domain-containing protein [Pseudomonadota bacterium]
MSEDRPANRLAAETSAYLRQHQHNPVDWYPWGPEALGRAAREDKPLLVSIGYSACHWCHVMEHESFEHEETAALMNEHFVNIKVDREERPDVDQLYMDTVVRLTGHGGWPLTVFCTPDGRPFYGGTYYPPERRHNMPAFRDVLAGVSHAYRESRGEVEESAAQILRALAARPSGEGATAPGRDQVAAGARAVLSTADVEYGGFGGAPKFPTPTNLELLLAAGDALLDEEATAAFAHVYKTCLEMARRGLYDHLGGGFHRYCVDGHWGIPHFEKMLYDQGLLLRVYAEVLRRSAAPDAELVWPIRETAAYLARELSAEPGGFLASQDADSEGEEGKYYVWTPAELEAVLGPEAEAFAAAYGVTPQGNFEGGTTHLIDRERAPRERHTASREALLAARTERVAPATDRKRIAAWNGYTVSGLARASSVLEDPELLAQAVAAADFVWDHMRDPDGRLLRVWNEGRAHVPAFLDDHAALLDAWLDLHRAGAGDRFLATALELADAVCERFYDRDQRDLFLTPADGERLAHRPRSDHDGATPHATGLAVLGLLRAAEISGLDDLRQVAERVIETHGLLLERAPQAFPTLLRAVLAAREGLAVAVVVGEPDAQDTRALAARARRVLRPEDAVLVSAPGADAPKGVDPTWLRGREARDGATAYLCRGTACSLPVTEPDAFRADLVAAPTAASGPLSR